jgi:hypothetical protein
MDVSKIVKIILETEPEAVKQAFAELRVEQPEAIKRLESMLSEVDFNSLSDNMRSNQLQPDGSYKLMPSVVVHTRNAWSMSDCVAQELWEKTGLLLTDTQKRIVQSNYDYLRKEIAKKAAQKIVAGAYQLHNRPVIGNCKEREANDVAALIAAIEP